MARKSTARSQPTVVRIASVKPRNLLAVAARKRSAGPHGPTRKAERAASKVRLRKRPDEA